MLFLFDSRSPTVKVINLPQQIEDVFTISLNRYSVLLGIRAFKILSATRQGSGYILIPKQLQLDTRIRQVWSNGEKVLTLNQMSVYVFYYYNIDYTSVVGDVLLTPIRLTHTIDTSQLVEPIFHAIDKKIIISSSTKPPMRSSL